LEDTEVGRHNDECGVDERVGPRLARYLSGRLTEAEELDVEAHLARCRRCRAQADRASHDPSTLDS
jgi:anti-sigma factor RsiW